MTIIRIADFGGDTIVLHFGGPIGNIDTYTFANSLLGFADTARAINEITDPYQEIELILEALGEGSFRALIRRIKKGYGGFFSKAIEAVFWGIVANTIYDAIIKNEPNIEIIINSNEVVIHRGNDKIIVPRIVYEATENAKKNSKVQQGLRHTFEALEADRNITDFGLTSGIADPQPILNIPRIEFPIAIFPTPVTETVPKEQIRREKARLVILKAWLNHAKRKWSFEWNGVPLSAPISDVTFLDRLARREYLLGAGDALDVEITFRQFLEPQLGVYVNDQNSFVVSKVEKVISSGP